MIHNFSSIYSISIALLAVLTSVVFSLLSLNNKNNMKMGDAVFIRFTKNKWMIILFVFLFYYFLPMGAVNDYVVYAEYYIERQLNIYGYSYEYFSSRDSIFFNYVEMLSYLGVDYRVAYGLIVAFYMFALSLVAVKHNVNTWFVFLLVITFGNIYFVVSGLRQAAAMAFLLLAYCYYVDRRLLQTIGLVLLASGFHSSAFLGALLIWSCLYLAKSHRSKYILIVLCFVSFPLLFGQIQGKSLINLILPYLSFLIPDGYLRYSDAVEIFDVGESFGLGFAFYTLAKIYFLVLVLFLSLRHQLQKQEKLIVMISLAYILFFNVFGLNQFTHRLLNYLAPFLLVAIPLTISKASSFNSLSRRSGVIFVITSGVFAAMIFTHKLAG